MHCDVYVYDVFVSGNSVRKWHTAVIYGMTAYLRFRPVADAVPTPVVCRQSIGLARKQTSQASAKGQIFA
jgi:hypothetical protein